MGPLIWAERSQSYNKSEGVMNRFKANGPAGHHQARGSGVFEAQDTSGVLTKGQLVEQWQRKLLCSKTATVSKLSS